MSLPRPNIFHFLDFRDFMRAYFEFSKAEDPGFSMRTFLGKVSHTLSSSGLLSAVLKGTRKLSPALRLKFAQVMELKDKESQYFQLLVQFNHAKSMEVKNHFFQQLSRFRESKAKTVSNEQYGFYSKWYYLVVWCYFGMEQKQKNPHEIAKRITPHLSVSQVEEAIAKLLQLKLIKKTANGYSTTDNHITTEKEVQDMVANHHHKEFIQMASRMVDEIPAAKRQYNTLVFSVSKQAFEIVKERMETFQEELREILTRDSREEMICTLSMQLYPNVDGEPAPAKRAN
ncbi:MAG: TIGR02147 family protein [Fibrobacteria bacterium]